MRATPRLTYVPTLGLLTAHTVAYQLVSSDDDERCDVTYDVRLSPYISQCGSGLPDAVERHTQDKLSTMLLLILELMQITCCFQQFT